MYNAPDVPELLRPRPGRRGEEGQTDEAREEPRRVRPRPPAGGASHGCARLPYTSAIRVVMTSTVNSSARARPAWPSSARRTGSERSSISASASAAGSSGGTSTPYRPPSSTDGMPPTRVATTGTPSASASTSTRPIPSLRDGTATTSAATT
ncbi:MAG: hypothetical protein DME17_02630 [Candidatus Rokuibacteriota bacterium]|nr:MAG: hypothetical protein DME17_02630 [Candidatus Rokubacteria bacterium]